MTTPMTDPARPLADVRARPAPAPSAAPRVVAVPPAPRRRALQGQLRRLRWRRRAYACSGLAVLAGLLAATIAVLGVLR